MSDRPIIFSAPMVRALLDGRKTQTRRIYKVPAGSYVQNGRVWAMTDGCAHGDAALPYAPGDRLWVKETWRTSNACDHMPPRQMPKHGVGIYFEADGNAHPLMSGRLRSPIHMPRWASRLTLTVTDVRVQRVQEISEEDAKAEGVKFWEREGSARDQFRDLWNTLHGPDAWGANPWVCALAFTVARAT